MDDIQKHILAERAVAAAHRCVANRYAGAAFAYATGSLLRGEGPAF